MLTLPNEFGVGRESDLSPPHSPKSNVSNDGQDIERRKQRKKQIQEAAEWIKTKLLEHEFFLNYNKKIIMIVFVTVFISNIYCNVDHGTLPGGSVAIKESLKLSDF